MKKYLAISVFSAMVAFCQSGLVAEVMRDNGVAEDITRDNSIKDEDSKDSSVPVSDSGMAEGVTKESAMADGVARDSSMPDGVSDSSMSDRVMGSKGILANARCPVLAKGQIDSAIQAAGQPGDSCLDKGKAAAYAACEANPDSLKDAIQAGIQAFKDCRK